LRFSGVLARKARGADGCHYLGLALLNLALDSKLPGCDSVSVMAVSRDAPPIINGRNGSIASLRARVGDFRLLAESRHSLALQQGTFRGQLQTFAACRDDIQTVCNSATGLDSRVH